MANYKDNNRLYRNISQHFRSKLSHKLSKICKRQSYYYNLIMLSFSLNAALGGWDILTFSTCGAANDVYQFELC